MTGSQPEAAPGTVRLPQPDVAWRTVRIRRPLGEIEAAWARAGIPGAAEFAEAPGDRGVEVSVELAETSDATTEHQLSPYEGGSQDQRLESALRAFKARLETGEVATTDGQPSGRAGE